MLTSIRFKPLLAFAAVALIAGVTALIADAGSGSNASSGAGSGATVYRLDTDHATYSAIPAVSSDAAVIVVGEVLSHSIEPGESPGVDALGDPLPAIPRTEYQIQVSSVIKGSLAPGSVIVVALPGGVSPEGEFVLDGAPQIEDGEVLMLFLVESGGVFYPLAGGAAVAAHSGELFVLPSDATGDQPLTFNEATVVAAVSSSAGPSTAPSVGPNGQPTLTHRPRHCPKGKKKRKKKGVVKCVRKRHHRHKHHHGRHGKHAHHPAV
jgi:hypothetical protein